MLLKKTNEYYKQKSEGVATVLKDNSLVVPNTEEINSSRIFAERIYI